MNTETHKRIIREIYDRLERGDRGAFAGHLDVNYVWRFPSKASWSRRHEGQAQVRDKLLGPLFYLFEGPYTARLTGLIAEGNVVAAEIQGHVVLKSGKIYDNQYCMLFHFRDEKIVEVVEYCDTDLEERVLGPYEDALKAYENRVPQDRAQAP